MDNETPAEATTHESAPAVAEPAPEPAAEPAPEPAAEPAPVCPLPSKPRVEKVLLSEFCDEELFRTRRHELVAVFRHLETVAGRMIDEPEAYASRLAAIANPHS